MRTPGSTFDLRVESRFKNGLLFRALDQFLGPGWTNTRAAEYCGVWKQEFGNLIRLKVAPMIYRQRRWKTGEKIWRASVLRISEKLGYNPEELFPQSLYSLSLPDVVVRDFASPEIVSLQEAAGQKLLPVSRGDEDLFNSFVRGGVIQKCEDAINTLSPREQRIIRARFGLGDDQERTLEEIGLSENVGKERIRQIEAKALRKLRHPSRSHKLRECIEVVL